MYSTLFCSISSISSVYAVVYWIQSVTSVSFCHLVAWQPREGGSRREPSTRRDGLRRVGEHSTRASPLGIRLLRESVDKREAALENGHKHLMLRNRFSDECTSVFAMRAFNGQQARIAWRSPTGQTIAKRGILDPASSSRHLSDMNRFQASVVVPTCVHARARHAYPAHM